MSSVVISGNTSGAITLSAPDVAGTNTITLPAATGTAVITGTTPTLNGITFPAVQVPSADANTLDDYEEGTYAPIPNAASGSITSYTSGGKYTKIGNVVNVFATITLTNVGTASGQLSITLPFTPNYSSSTDQSSATVRESAATGNIYFASISTGSNKIAIQNSTNGGIQWSNNYQYPVQITYFTS